MVRLPWEKDRCRTCNNCGESWTVPYGLRGRQKAVVRKRPRPSAFDKRLREPPGTAQEREEAAQTPIDEPNTRRAVAKQADELAIRLALCPVCGSRSWSEEILAPRGRRTG